MLRMHFYNPNALMCKVPAIILMLWWIFYSDSSLCTLESNLRPSLTVNSCFLSYSSLYEAICFPFWRTLSKPTTKLETAQLPGSSAPVIWSTCWLRPSRDVCFLLLQNWVGSIIARSNFTSQQKIEWHPIFYMHPRSIWVPQEQIT